MAQRPLENWFSSIPPITKIYASACFATTLVVHLELVSPLSLYLNFYSIYHNYEFWRLITNFLWFGPFGLNFLFHMYFLVRHSSSLEDGSFVGRTADYLYMLIFGGVLLLLIDWIFYLTSTVGLVMFLAQALSFMVVYVWSRRNPGTILALFGLFQFSAPYLPWVFLLIGFLLDQNPMNDILGMVAGHIYFFFEDVYPLYRPNRRILATPSLLKNLFAPVAPHPHQD